MYIVTMCSCINKESVLDPLIVHVLLLVILFKMKFGNTSLHNSDRLCSGLSITLLTKSYKQYGLNGKIFYD